MPVPVGQLIGLSRLPADDARGRAWRTSPVCAVERSLSATVSFFFLFEIIILSFRMRCVTCKQSLFAGGLGLGCANVCANGNPIIFRKMGRVNIFHFKIVENESRKRERDRENEWLLYWLMFGAHYLYIQEGKPLREWPLQFVRFVTDQWCNCHTRF